MSNKILTGIYSIENPEGKVYIGSSRNIYRRWDAYFNLRCVTQPSIYDSLVKYGVDNHVFKVIVELDITIDRTDLVKMEATIFTAFRLFGHSMINRSHFNTYATFAISSDAKIEFCKILYPEKTLRIN